MNKTWFITGTSSGFGRVLTERLLERGDRVAATLRKPALLDSLAARYGERLWVAALDVTDMAAIRRVVDLAFAALGRIDVIVNNAGYGLFGAAEEVTAAQIDHQVGTNLLGSIEVIRAALPHLRRQGGGRILQLSSVAGQVAFPGLSLYHATKWGIEGFCEALAAEVAAFGIQVTLIEPGSARTNFMPGLASAPALPYYAGTPVGQMRQAAAAGAFPAPAGDPVKMALAMIACTEQAQAPRRVTLGRDAYQMIHSALSARLASLEAQRELALSTDFDKTGDV